MSDTEREIIYSAPIRSGPDPFPQYYQVKASNKKVRFGENEVILSEDDPKLSPPPRFVRGANVVSNNEDIIEEIVQDDDDDDDDSEEEGQQLLLLLLLLSPSMLFLLLLLLQKNCYCCCRLLHRTEIVAVVGMYVHVCL